MRKNKPGNDSARQRLREAIVRHLGLFQAVVAGPEDVVVTAGAQQALDLIARVLLAPGDCAAVEEPGYPPVWQLLRAHGVRVVPVPVDGEGLRVSALPDRARLVRDALPPVPAGGAALPAPAPGAAGVEPPPRRRGGGGRLRQRLPLRRAAPGAAAEPRPAGASALRGHLLQGAAAGAAAGLRGRAPEPHPRPGRLPLPAGPAAGAAAFLEEGLLARQVRPALKGYGERRAALREGLARELGGRAEVVPGVPGCT